MPSVVGSLKSNSLVLQGHGPNSTAGHDVAMHVVNNEFTMKMGNDVLMTVGKDEVTDSNSGGTVVTTPHDHDDEYSTVDHTHLAFAKDVKFHKNVEVHGDLHVKGDDLLKPKKMIVIESEDQASKYIYEVLGKPLELFQAAYDKYEADPTSSEEVMFPMGDLREEQYEAGTNGVVIYEDKPAFKEFKYQWLGAIDSNKIALADMKKMKVNEFSYDLFANVLCGLYPNMDLVLFAHRSNNNLRRPWFVKNPREVMGMALPTVRKYLTLIETLLTKDLNPYTTQGIDFAKVIVDNVMRALTVENMPMQLASDIAGRSGYQRILKGGVQGGGFAFGQQINFPDTPSVGDILDPSTIDWEEYIYRLKFNDYWGDATDYWKRQGVMLSEWEVDGSSLNIGYDKTKGSLEVNFDGTTTGKPAWDVEGVKVSWAMYQNQQPVGTTNPDFETWFEKDGPWMYTIKFIKGEYDWNTEKTQPFPFFYRSYIPASRHSRNNPLFDKKQYMTEDQWNRITNILNGTLKPMAMKWMSYYKDLLQNRAQDEFPWQWRNKLSAIDTIDMPNRKVVLKNGERVPFSDGRIASQAKLAAYLGSIELIAHDNISYIMKDTTKHGLEFSDIDEIFSSYKTINAKTVPVTNAMLDGKVEDGINEPPVNENGDIEMNLPVAIYNAGKNLTQFYDDIKGFSVAGARDAGLLNGSDIDFSANSSLSKDEQVKQGVSYLIRNNRNRSDWDALGYHYGLPLVNPKVIDWNNLSQYANGNIEADFGPAALAKKDASVVLPTYVERLQQLDSFNRPRYTGTFPNNKEFEYVLREHYKVDENFKPIKDDLGDYVRDGYSDFENDWFDMFNEQYGKASQLEILKKFFLTRSFFAKSGHWACDSIANCLYYKDVGSAKGILYICGAYTQQVLDDMRAVGVIGFVQSKNGGSATGYGRSIWYTSKNDTTGQILPPGVSMENYREVFRTDVADYTPPTLIAADIDPAGRDKVYFGDVIINGGTAAVAFGSNNDTSNPQSGNPFRYDTITNTHESFIGHGFTTIYPQVVSQLGRVYPAPLFPITSNASGPHGKIGWRSSNVVDMPGKPEGNYNNAVRHGNGVMQSGSFNEGFASYGELMNIKYGIYAPVNLKERTQDWSVGGVNVDYVTLIIGIAASSRLSARLVTSARMSYPPLALPFPIMFREFAESIGYVNNFIVSCLQRFINDRPWQQATYAVGLLATFGVVNKVKKTMVEKGLVFSDPKFNTWRFFNADIFGVAFERAALAEIDKGTFTA